MSVEFNQKSRYNIKDLLEIMEYLRGENGCPWDAEQTHKSIRNNFLEETYEAIEAIDNNDAELLKEELGDVLLQVVFHSQMESEQGVFNFDDVADGICKKLVERHPHIFADVKVGNTDEVLANWDMIKQKKKGQTTYTETLTSVPRVFPALVRSTKIQSRAAKSGFDYPDLSWAMKDLESELVELKLAIENKDVENSFEELGDLLFSVVNVSRFISVDAEHSLSASCDKFIRRFELVEKIAMENNINMSKSSMNELDRLWKQAKKSQNK